MSRDRRQRSKQRLRRRDDDSSGQILRSDLPGALDHASGEVDEFDAALVRGAEGALAAEDDAELAEQREEERVGRERGSATETAESRRRGGNGAVGNAAAVPATREEAAVAPRASIFSRAIAFLRASWAELQRVQWPDRPEVFQATAVVLGFVAVMGVYLGVADWLAQKIINFIL